MTPTPVQLLAFEAEGWTRQGSKEQAIRARFNLAPTAYYALLRKAIYRQDAVAAHPGTAKRLQRIAERKADLRWRTRWATSA